MKNSKFVLFISFIFISLLWSTLANENLFAQPDNIPSEIGTNHAFIIGIEKYNDSAWGSSRNSVKDANKIAKILKEKYDFKPENITLLTDETGDKPDGGTIGSYLTNYKNSLTDKDNLLIFFSGHSEEDEEGQTFWIPRDGDKGAPLRWLKHEDICSYYLESGDFKAKNVIILTDSRFSTKLLKKVGIPYNPARESQYRKKILYLAEKKSRQVIAFGDKRTQPSTKYNDSSMFTYFVHKALDENWLDVSEFVHLIYNREFQTEALKVAGARIMNAKLKKTEKDMKGFALIARVVKAPQINITRTFPSPPKDEAGKNFIITATTDRPTYAQVLIEIPGILRRPRAMKSEGDGTTWKLSLPIRSIGTFKFTVYAENEDNIEGEKKTGTVEAMVPTEGIVRVASSSVTPKKGNIGQDYSFTAKTDSPAKRVNIVIKDKEYSMKGSGTSWSLKTKIPDYGNISYSVIALNEKDIEGLPEKGLLQINAPKIKITNISSPKGYAGDLFTIKVTTDYTPQYVELNLNGKNYKMQGSELNWQFKREIPDIGSQSFTVTAVNTEDDRGAPRKGTLVAEERPPGIPDIARVTISPATPQAGIDFVIKVDTKEAAKDVFVEIGGKSYAMSGSGKEWIYETKIASIGRTNYEITAKNKNGIQGKKREGTITTIKKEGIDIAQFTVTPSKGYPGDNFTWKAVTAEPADSVTITIDDKLYPMEGSGRNWTYTKTISDFGFFDISTKAKDNKGKEGGARSVSLRIEDRIANVRAPANVKVPQSPNSYAGEDFVFEVETDNPAETVSLDLNGSLFEMTGSGRNWKYTHRINEVGTNAYSIIAKNREDKTGRPLAGKFESKFAILSTTLSPAQILAGERFSINATMNAPASEAIIEIDGKKISMTGAGTSWDYSTSIAVTGSKDIKISAIARDGKTSVPLQKTITIVAPPVNVTATKVTPKTDYWAGGDFTFRSTTDKEAVKVVLSLEGNNYQMEKSGNEWTTSIKISKNIDKVEEVDYSVAALNETETSGRPFTGLIKIKPLGDRYKPNEDGTLSDKLSGQRVERYIDNGDGTITDRFAGLMLFNAPLRTIRSYDEAEKEIDELNNEKYKGYTGWRLPTATEWNSKIIDRTQTSPTLPAGHPFRNVNTYAYFWSKTDHKTITGRKYAADLARGKIQNESKSEELFIWPVRAVDID
ncbi:DUF1566 domain-containing protein [Thermodesulfobacteriota bacterium]